MEGVNLLKRKKALITGAGKGIGRAAGLAFAANGADVSLVSRTAREVEELAAEIRKNFGVKAISLVADVSNSQEARAVVEKTETTLGSIDALICAAGYPFVKELWDKKMLDLQDDDFLKIFQVDVLGSFRVIKSALPGMMQRRNGVIIIFSSTPALAGYEKGGAYTLAKAANLGLAKEIAAEYGSYNIRAYAIAPGNIKTIRTFDQLTSGEQEKLSSESPMKRWGNPEEVANVAVTLASDNMSFVTGQTIVVDGGTVML